MFINKADDGKNNICGENIKNLRKEKQWSQRQLADKLQISGLNVDKNAIQRIESGARFITDIEIRAIKNIFNVSYDDLIK